MHVYRIVLEKWSQSLTASGQAARWNSPGRFVLYTAGSRALACLENVVHRNSRGLNQLFKTMVIAVPDDVLVLKISEADLPDGWHEFNNYHITQQLGDEWLDGMKSAVLAVPSAIIPAEQNFLFNPQHPDFQKIKLLQTEDFVFDPRIKTN
ncbi:MAG: RES family NAD+ phosphorylase [Saprospiraceae bacterium]|jgi:RES domain-containing protein|nr:RES family NAD+ phosphorylase [Saprospiraceae bacterium]